MGDVKYESRAWDVSQKTDNPHKKIKKYRNIEKQKYENIKIEKYSSREKTL